MYDAVQKEAMGEPAGSPGRTTPPRAGLEMDRSPMRSSFDIGGQNIAAGARQLVDLPVSRLSNHTPVTLPVHVVHGARPGPTLFVSGAVHGDEIIGVEVIRRLLKAIAPERVAGTLLCVPIVNAFGFIGRTRYLPDQRDLNRSFPGSEGGSLAAKLAYLLMQEVVRRSDVGIDLHSAAASRTNLPQIRTDLRSPRAKQLAEAFGAPVILRSPEREGSLRKAAGALGKDVLVYEAGEALRFDMPSIQIGVRGVQRVMSCLGMLPDTPTALFAEAPPIVSTSSRWVRAPEGGILRAMKTTGDRIREGERLGVISNPYDDSAESEVLANISGLVVGRTNLPVVNLGDALFHIARVPETSTPWISPFDSGADPVFDEDEII